MSLDSRELESREDPIDAKANDLTPAPWQNVPRAHQSRGRGHRGVAVARCRGKLISDNTYVQAGDDAGYQKLNSLKPQKLKLRATAATAGDERVITVQIANNGKEAALGTKLTLVDHMGVRILPALYSDNYLTVLPGEPRVVEIRYPAKLGIRATVKVRGWNVQESRFACRAVETRPTYRISIRNPGSSR